MSTKKLSCLYSDRLCNTIAYGALIFAVVTIMSFIGFAVYVVHNNDVYIEHINKCDLLAQHLPPADQLGFNFSKAQNNLQVQNYIKECF